MNPSVIEPFQLILASQSPRRQQLLAGMDLPFTILTKEVDESFPDDLPVLEVAAYLSKKKSLSFDLEMLPPHYLLITADTVVIVEDRILNKAAHKSEAIEMLSLLSGKTHQVVTGVCLRWGDKTTVFNEVSEVKFATLTPSEMQWYVDKYKPFDKAGAYGIQEWVGYIGIESVKGSYYNVMGLPTHRLYQTLKRIVGADKEPLINYFI